jgi:3-hydroxyisobutyrate dehydrogenase
MRALNSLVTAIDFAATIEAMQIGRRYGLDPKLMLDVFNSSTGTNHATAEEIAPFVLTGRFNSGLSLQQLVREATAALGVASTTKTDVPLCRTAGELWRMAEAGLEPGADHTALARWYEHRSGTRLRS